MSTTTRNAAPITSTKTGNHNFNPIVLHYVLKSNIVESAVMGSGMVALCGEQWSADKTNYGATLAGSKTHNSVICPMCADVLDGMTGG